MCGLRVSEALSLKVDDIDFSLNCLSVRKAKSDIVTEDIGISTHDLTKRSTGKSCFLCKETGISTHDLTKRSTSISDSFQSSFLFQLTTSRRGRLARLHNDNKASIFQLTTSRRGRPSKKITSVICTNISTHDLTKRSTCIGVDNESAELFQLTTSRRGRRNKPLSFQSHSLFQLTTSRRGRHPFSLTPSHSFAFQLTTSRRGRLMPQGMFRPPAYFNSRHHEEVDDFRKGLPSFPFSFQLTTSRRGRRSADRFTFLLTYFNSRHHEEVDSKIAYFIPHFCIYY